MPTRSMQRGVPDGVTIVQFADDTQILVTSKKQDLATIISLTETALHETFRWFCQHGMKTNASKTKMLVLGTPAMLRSLPPVTVSFCGTELKDTGTVKNLGLHLDRHLNYQTHIDVMTAKCTGILIALSHARHVMPARTLKVVVQALVISIVRYSMSVYGSCGVTQMARVQISTSVRGSSAAEDAATTSRALSRSWVGCGLERWPSTTPSVQCKEP